MSRFVSALRSMKLGFLSVVVGSDCVMTGLNLYRAAVAFEVIMLRITASEWKLTTSIAVGI